MYRPSWLKVLRDKVIEMSLINLNVDFHYVTRQLERIADALDRAYPKPLPKPLKPIDPKPRLTIMTEQEQYMLDVVKAQEKGVGNG